MDFTPAIIGLAAYLLVWEKLPTWGTWFNATLKRLPTPLQTLYEQWRCPYCVGFWMGLAIHAATGLWSLPALAQMPEYWGAIGMPVSWFLDALATGTLILIGKLTLDAISLPAIKGHVQREAFMKSLADEQAKPQSS
jgi:hypothetical protein